MTDQEFAVLAQETEDFADRVTRLNETARRCAEDTIYLARLHGDDRNAVLRAVISRLKDATAA